MAGLLLPALLASACSTDSRVPDLGGLYNRAAQDHSPTRNPVILIPGILGSRLRDGGSGRTVWGAFDGDYADPKTPEGARLVSLPMREGVSLAELRDAVVPDGVLDRVRARFLGLPVGMSAYAYILAVLGVGGYRDELLGRSGAVDYGEDHYTCFQFDYDWRRDLVESAKRLDEFLARKRAYVRSEVSRRFGLADPEVRFDVVAHSMGALVLRYYLRYGAADLPADGTMPPLTWAGARSIDRAILVAPPNAGSPLALLKLVRGEDLGPVLPFYEPALLGTMPSLYELLPRPRHGALVSASDPTRRIEDFLSAERWERLGWGLVSPRQDRVLRMLLPGVPDSRDRRRIALDHVRKCLARARQFAEALDVPASPPEGLDLYLIAGDAEPTDAVLSADERGGTLRVVRSGPGDGVVLRSSALADDRTGGAWTPTLVTGLHWKQVIFLPATHLRLTSHPAFVDNLLYLLLEDPRPKARRGRTRTATARTRRRVARAADSDPSRAR
ncbi:MAG: hypothetical protein L0323_21120 [Planctomycetes bacterium]|nr:hypothetical protein [Planctomycetota bacterium]